MTRVLSTGAEIGDLLNLDLTSSVTASTDQPRSGSYSYKIAAGGNFSIALSSAAEYYVRMGVYVTGSPLTDIGILTFRRAGGNSIGGVQLNTTSGAVEIISSGGTVIATTTATWAYDAYFLFEARFKVSATVGAIEYRSDEQAAGGFSGNTGTDNITAIIISGGSGSAIVYIDDIAINDTSGGTDDSWPGDGHIEFLVPNADGDASDWVNSDSTSVNNWSYVDEIPPNGDTSYVTSSTPGDQDLYNLTPFSGTGKQVLRVWVEGRGKDSGLGDIKPLLKSGTTLDTGAAVALTASYDVFLGVDHTTNPDTGLAWTDSDLDALQAGQENV